MSKLPQASFGDKAMRQPPVLRFEGVRDDSPEALELARAFGPQIRQFYLKAAQGHAAGVVDVTHRQMQIGDAISAQYSNIQGQEIVTVKVGTGKRSKKKSSVEQLWDWALIDVTALPVAYTYDPPSIFVGVRYPGLVVGARLRSPRSERVTAVASTGALPLASDEEPVLEMARSETLGYSPSEMQQSLLVDMRSMGNIPQVQIELFAKLTAMQDDTTQAIVGKDYLAHLAVSYLAPQVPNYLDEFQDEFLDSDVAELVQYYPDYWPSGLTSGGSGVDQPLITDADVYAFFANITPPSTGELIVVDTPFGPYGPGMMELNTFLSASQPPPAPPLDTWIYERYFFLPRLGFVPVPVVLTTPSKIRGLLFMSDPKLVEYSGTLVVSSGTVTGLNSVWGRPGAPGPYNAPVVGDGPLLVSGDAGGDPEMDNMRFIGLVTIDRRTGGMSFKAA